MKILADENIPYVRAAFANIGDVQTVTGRQLTRTIVETEEAEILLVRSVTPVNANLLAGTKVRFVGTATIGYDHLDLDYLQQQNIAFASAPGSNATAAAEYVISTLLIMAERQGFSLSEKTVGIIGCGNVGSRVLSKLTALGVDCLVHDPPLQEKTGDSNFIDLDTVLSADILTLHVPLETTGRYPTYHLLQADTLAKLREDVVLINTSRGNVIDEKALLDILISRPAMTVVLDVWKNEPRINPLLLQRASLGTPHIAGYSLDGKVRGTEMLYAAVCHHFNCPLTWQVQDCLPPPPLTRLTFSDAVTDAMAIQTAVLACYDVRRDDVALRGLKKAENPGLFFDSLRKNYPVRREFGCLEVELPKSKLELRERLQGVGFKVR